MDTFFSSMVSYAFNVGTRIGLVCILITLLFLLTHYIFSARISRLRIQENNVSKNLLIHDFKWMVISFLFTGIVSTYAKYLYDLGVIKMSFGEVQIWQIVLEFCVFFVLFDIIYYFLHRLLHLGPIYQLVHKFHHKNTTPNYLTGFAFHPIESIAAGFIGFGITIAFQFHFFSFITIMVFQIVMNMSVHSGIEYFPKNWYRNWYTKWFISPTFHDMHHSRFNYNFGGFTTIMDRVFGSIHPDLIIEFDKTKVDINLNKNGTRLPVNNNGLVE